MRQTRFVASVWDRENDRISDSPMDEGRKVITFNAILKYNTFPLADIVRDILRLGVEEMRCPVEVEFAVNMDVPYGQQRIFNLLQIRPDHRQQRQPRARLAPRADRRCAHLCPKRAGRGQHERHPRHRLREARTFRLALDAGDRGELDALNARMREAGRGYILVGPGRVGVERSLSGHSGQVAADHRGARDRRMRIGTLPRRAEPGDALFPERHFAGRGLSDDQPLHGRRRFDAERLGAMPAAEEGEYLRRVSFPAPLWVYIDGRSNKGIVRTEPPAGEE